MAKTLEVPFYEAVNTAMDGRTNKWLSEKTGIAESEISRILNGRLIPSDAQKEKIKEIFPAELGTY